MVAGEKSKVPDGRRLAPLGSRNAVGGLSLLGNGRIRFCAHMADLNAPRVLAPLVSPAPALVGAMRVELTKQLAISERVDSEIAQQQKRASGFG